MSSKVETPFPIFVDIDGSPLEDGYVYVGTAGLDPSTNAITVYSDVSLSTVVAQPIRTKSGFPVVSGSPIRIYTGVGNFSLRVANKNNSQVLQDLNAGASVNIGVSLPDGSAAAPSLSNTGDSNTGLYFSAADELSIATGGVQRAVVDSSGNLLVGKTSANADVGATISPSGNMSLIADSLQPLDLFRLTDDGVLMRFFQGGSFSHNQQGQISISGTQLQVNGSGSLGLQTGGTTRATIDASGNLLVGKTSVANSVVGALISHDGQMTLTRADDRTLLLNRINSDGPIVQFLQDSTLVGSISISGTTTSYNGGHLARWSRMLDGSKPENLLKGTVMTNLDEMIEWAYPETPEEIWAAGDGLPEGVSVGDVKVEGVEATYWGEMGENVPEFAGDVKLGDVKTEAVEEVLWTETDGFPEGVQIGDVKVEYKPAGVEDNEQLNHTAISSVEADRGVAGVFIAWDDSDEYNDYHLAMKGDVIIRIAEGVEVKGGDLLVSAGNGTAKPLDPETTLTVGLQAAIVAKVTSKEVSCVYDDGSFCVPCELK